MHECITTRVHAVGTQEQCGRHHGRSSRYLLMIRFVAGGVVLVIAIAIYVRRQRNT